jgi:membrane protein DedA with SNARE-associated domain
MLQYFITLLSDATLPLIWILAFGVFITFLENIFPPAPCDSMLVFMGGLVSLGKVGFTELLIVTTLGSSLGFILMFYLGKLLGHRIIASNKIKFISEENLVKPRLWFNKYGYSIIVANRFLSGTRAVISFLAGMLEMKPTITIILSAISALVWNFILIYAGSLFGHNWKIIDEKISLYGYIIFPIMALIAVYFIVRYFIKRKKAVQN